MSPPRELRRRRSATELRARPARGARRSRSIVAIAALLSTEDVRADPKATAELGWKFCNVAARSRRHRALGRGIPLPWPTRSCAPQLFDVLREFAVAGKRREPNERFWRFYEIVARTKNDPDWMYVTEKTRSRDMRDARDPEDRHGAQPHRALSRQLGRRPGLKRRARRRKADLDMDDLGPLDIVLEAVHGERFEP